MAGLTGLEDEGLWSEETRRLCDVVDEIPTLVRVTEGIYSCNDAETFSQGDIIKLDACERMTRVSAFLTQPGRETKYEKWGSKISLPYNYNGRLKVLPLHGEYHKYSSVQELMDFYPRYVRVLSRIDFKNDHRMAVNLQPNDVLELMPYQNKREKKTITFLPCLLNGDTLMLPASLTGVFQVLPDESQRTLREVVNSYKLPQCVRFLNSGLEAIMSRDIQLAVDNLQSFNGEMIVTAKMESDPVLLGHYKGMHGADSSTRYVRRSAIVIPLNLPEIANITVQTPTDMDADDYELFLLKNFSQSSETPDGTLYAEFERKSCVQFITVDTAAAPAIPPRPKAKVDETTPTATSDTKKKANKPRTRQQPQATVTPKQHHEVKIRHPEVTSGKPEVQRSPPQTNQQSGAEGGFDFTMASVFGAEIGESDDNDIYEHPEQLHDQERPPLPMPVEKEKPSVFKAVKGLAKKVSNLKFRPEKRQPTPQMPDVDDNNDEEEDSWYDSVDESAVTDDEKTLYKSKIIGTQSSMSHSKHTESSPRRGHSDVNIERCTIDGLESILIECGMPDFARVCKQERIDGDLLVSLTNNVLKKKPFSLSDYKITKLEQVKSGWRPKT